MKRLYLLSGLLVLTSGLGAKIYTPDSSNDFFDVINRNPNAVVHYINYEKVDDKLKEQALIGMKAAFAQSANESSHMFANIAFIGANSRVAANLPTDLEARYNLKKALPSDFSVIFLIKDGKPITDSTGYLATLTDAFDQADLGTFIQKYLGDYISYRMQQNEAQRVYQPVRTVTRVVEQPVYRYASPVYVDRYYDDYYDGYYGRPRIGFGFGFGRGFGGWGRRGWGRRGIGFGFGF